MLFQQLFQIYGKHKFKEPSIVKEYCRDGQIRRIIRGQEEKLMDWSCLVHLGLLHWSKSHFLIWYIHYVSYRYYWKNKPTNYSRYGFIYDNYTSIWNILDYPAITIPIIPEEPLEKHTNLKHQPRNELEKRIWTDCKFPFTSHTLYSVLLVMVWLTNWRFTRENDGVASFCADCW